jgi:hypothetical protein
MQVVCCIASGGIVRGVFLPFPPQPTTKKRPPSNAAGPFDIGGSVQRRDDALAAVRFRSPKISREMKIYLYKTSFSVASLYYPSVRNAVADLAIGKTDQIPTLFFFETIKSPDSDYYLALGTQDTRAYIAHRNNEFYYLFHFQKTKNEKKKSILDKLFITLKK